MNINQQLVIRTLGYSFLLGGLIPMTDFFGIKVIVTSQHALHIIAYSGGLGVISYAWSYFTTWLENYTNFGSTIIEIPFVLSILYLLCISSNTE